MESHSTTTSSAREEQEKYLDKNFTIIVNTQLGKGGFGQIYLGRNLKENKKIAIKVEDNSNNHSHLYLEYDILKTLQGWEGIPHIYKYRQGHKHNYLIMELLGKSLDRLFSDCKKHFSMKTIFEIGYQLIQRIELVHSKGYIHRDIKPGNFVLGRGENNKIIYIIDFGLSKRYIDKQTNKHIPYKEGKGLTGTARYVSLFTHYGIEQSRRDDIEGIAFNLIYFARGKLPWQGKIMESKIYYKPKKLCQGLSSELACLLEYARDLEFEEKPDYKNIKLMFKSSIEELNEKMDWVFDWDLPKIEGKKEEKKLEEKSEEKNNKDNNKKNLDSDKKDNSNKDNNKNTNSNKDD